ncbi:MAG: polymer-forming cytoskeletal protein, partial [Oscillospiraceae bacterium]
INSDNKVQNDVAEPVWVEVESSPTTNVEFKPKAPAIVLKETYINSATVINGSISVKTDIVIEGRITGDVIAENNVNVSGKIDGNIEGNMVSISGGYVIGNVNAKSDLITDSSAVIIGDVVAQNFNSDGKIKGNLKISNAISLSSNAVIFGNVTSKSIIIQDGAVIKGNLQILSPKSENDDVFTYPNNLDDMLNYK